MIKKYLAKLLIPVLCLSVLSGCAGDTKETQSTKNEKNETDNETNYDPFGKYEEPVKITSVLSFNPPPPYVKEGTTPENNAFVNAIRNDLNIDFEWLWSVPYEQYAQKFGVAMASQQLPDIFSVSSIDYQILLENEQIMPWNEALKYASDDLKKRIYSDPFPITTTTDEEGNIMAIPRYWEPERNFDVMMIRKDWLDELGLEVPKTTDELEVVAEAFVKEKGVKAGISLSNGNLSSIMAMFGVYLDKWVLDDDGKLIVGDGNPDAKDVLDILKKWYKLGIINKEYALADTNTLKEWVISEELGIIIAPWWAAANYISPELQRNKGSYGKWASAPIPRKDGTNGAILDKMSLDSAGGYWVINKNCKNPEAIVKMLNKFVEIQYTEDSLGKNGYFWSYNPISFSDPAEITQTYSKFNEQIDIGNFETLPVGSSQFEIKIFENLKEYCKWQNGEIEYPDDSAFNDLLARVDKDFVWGTTMKAVEDGEYVVNQFYGPPTPIMKERKATLDKLRDETFAKIIMGEIPIDDFDKYLKNWGNMGGTEMIEEVNEWYLDKKDK